MSDIEQLARSLLSGSLQDAPPLADRLAHEWESMGLEGADRLRDLAVQVGHPANGFGAVMGFMRLKCWLLGHKELWEAKR